MAKTVEQRRKEVLAQVYESRAAIERKLDTKGFVVAGYGGDTYYSFVGEGRGFGGAALTPVSQNPVIFNSRKAAEREAYNGTYRNGGGDVIALEVVEAATYFQTIHKMISSNIVWMEETLSNL